MSFKLLIGMPIISRDAEIVQHSLKALSEQLRKDGSSLCTSLDVLLVTRSSDYTLIMNSVNKFRENRRFNVTIHRVKDYSISERHNLKYVAKKRQYILKYAADNAYDALLFLDADVIMNSDTLHDMIFCCTSDVTICSYKPCWGTERILCAKTDKLFSLDEFEKKTDPLPTCISIKGGGLGCALIRKSAFHVPIVIGSYKVHDDLSIDGEDVGFFQNCFKYGVSVCCLTGNRVSHEPVLEKSKENSQTRVNKQE